MLSCAAKLFNTKDEVDHAGRCGKPPGAYQDQLLLCLHKEDLIYQCYDANMRQAHAQLDAAEAACDNPSTCLMAFLESQITTLRALDAKALLCRAS